MPEPVGPTMPTDSPGRTHEADSAERGLGACRVPERHSVEAQLPLEPQRRDDGPRSQRRLVAECAERLQLLFDEVGRRAVELDLVGKEQDLVERGEEAEGAGEDEADGGERRGAAAGQARDSDDEHGADDERRLEHVAQASVHDVRSTRRRVDSAGSRDRPFGVEERAAAQLQLLGRGDSLEDEPVPLLLELLHALAAPCRVRLVRRVPR